MGNSVMQLRRWIAHKLWFQPDTISPPHKALHVSRPLRNACLGLSAFWKKHWAVLIQIGLTALMVLLLFLQYRKM